MWPRLRFETRCGRLRGDVDVYRRASLSNEGDRPHLLANPAYLELSDAAVLPGRSLVAVVEGRVVGFATVDPVDDGLELEALFVDPDWMRHRVGTALLAAVAERARRTGLSMITVNANVARRRVLRGRRLPGGRRGRARVRSRTPDGVAGVARRR